MSIEVEWQIIEGEGHEAEMIVAPPPPRPKRRLSKWAIAFLAIPVIALAIVSGYAAWMYQTQLSRVAREVTVVARAEARAIAANDQASFMALQDPNDPTWRAIQERRFGRLERVGIPEFGLGAASMPPQLAGVTLEPGGARLDLLYRFPVTQPMPGGPVSITLRVPQFYKQTPSGWVHAQPSAEFWGSRRSLSSKRILAMYSRRDADIVEPLIPHMEAVLQKACANLACPPQVIVSFETSPDSAGYWGISTFSFDDSSLTLKLASPYLAGLPTDTVSRDELYRAIETRLVRGLVASNWPGQRTGANSIAFQHMVRWHLAEVGLEGPYITPEITTTLIAAMQSGASRPLSTIPLRARSTGAGAALDEAMVPLAFAFIAERLGADSLTRLAPAMATSTTIGEALRRTLRLNPTTLEADWQAYLRRQAGLTSVAEVIPSHLGVTGQVEPFLQYRAGSYPDYRYDFVIIEPVSTTNILRRSGLVILARRPFSDQVSVYEWRATEAMRKNFSIIEQVYTP